MGFEPTVPKGHNGFRDRPIRPLSHPSSSQTAAHSLVHPKMRPIVARAKRRPVLGAKKVTGPAAFERSPCGLRKEPVTGEHRMVVDGWTPRSWRPGNIIRGRRSRQPMSTPFGTWASRCNFGERLIEPARPGKPVNLNGRWVGQVGWRASDARGAPIEGVPLGATLKRPRTRA